jgi:hypothetical protein
MWQVKSQQFINSKADKTQTFQILNIRFDFKVSCALLALVRATQQQQKAVTASRQPDTTRPQHTTTW